MHYKDNKSRASANISMISQPIITHKNSWIFHENTLSSPISCRTYIWSNTQSNKCLIDRTQGVRRISKILHMIFTVSIHLHWALIFDRFFVRGSNYDSQTFSFVTLEKKKCIHMNKNLWKLLLQKYCSSTLIAMKMLYAKLNPNLISKIKHLMFLWNSSLYKNGFS